MTSDIRFLHRENAVFASSPGGMLSLRVDDETYPVVYLHCSFPHSDPERYISVRLPDDKEVGMIRSLSDFGGQTAELLREHIRIRYFAPAILSIKSIREEFGYSFWEAETTAGTCRFTVRSGGGNVKTVTDKKLLITDVSGNRFVIEDIGKLSDREYRMVEMCM